MTYFAIIITLLMVFFLKRTRWGLNLNAVGESPATADAAGINVTLYKYLATVIDGLYILYLYIPGLGRSMQEIFKMLPYLVTIIVLIITSLRKKREQQPPESLGLAYFREDR